jgi:hypothetical protein
MTFLRIVLAVVLTAGLLYIARTNSRGRPENITHTENGYTFQMTTTPKGYTGDTARILVDIEGPLDDNVFPVIRTARFGQDAATPLNKYDTTPLHVADSLTGRYDHLITAGKRGGKYFYYFEIRDRSGGLRARFTDEGEPFVLKYVGHVPTWILLAHIVLIFAAVFFVAMGSLHGVDLARTGGSVRPMAKAYFWATVVTFLGGYPFGWAMNWYTFGTVWEGVPFGTDATDNKTQLLFVYFLFVVLASLGSLTQRKFGRNAFRPKTLGVLGAVGFFVMLAIYLIPHSIQFSPGLTRAVCWSFIGLVAAIYIYGWLHSRSWKGSPSKPKKTR